MRIAAICAAALLAACQGPLNDERQAFMPPSPASIRLEPAVETLAFAGPALAASDRAALARFAGAYARTGSGAITLQAAPEARAAGAEAAAELVAAGIPGGRIRTTAGAPGSGVALSFMGTKAAKPECANWAFNAATTLRNDAMPWLGCATAANIAAMVADPRDLVTPRAMDPADGARRDTVIGKWRKGEVTSAQGSEDDNGDVASMGGK